MEKHLKPSKLQSMTLCVFDLSGVSLLDCCLLTQQRVPEVQNSV